MDWVDFDKKMIDSFLKFCYAQNNNVPQKASSCKEDPAPEGPEKSSAEHSELTKLSTTCLTAC
ncbi:hypothetical protein N7463_002922 [Penicillium fimorum]|uniref:Uncharacterized protein n=1 Tax=Penicillium fimorum TaxID=1882269 RepID=A0A9W9Y0R9_9EURO|nr:hypothetical protein N7463_002922 [Penicillium fimorum]